MAIILSLDLGAESVKALLAQTQKDGTLKVLGVGHAKQQPGNMYSGAIADIPAVTATCSEAISTAEQQAKVTAKNVVVGIAGELVDSQITSVHYHRDNARAAITDREISNIIKQVQDKAATAARSRLAAKTNSSHAEVRLVNSALVSMSIDGSKVNNPTGFKGADISAQLYTAFAPRTNISAIEKICAELNLELLSVAVEPFAACRALIDGNQESEISGLIFDIGAAATDVAAVVEGGVVGTKTFAVGGRNFKKSPADAFAVWATGIQIALEEFSDLQTLPTKIFVCGGGAKNADFQEFLAVSDWYKSLPFARRPLISILEPAALPAFDLGDAQIDCSFITALGLLRVGSDTLPDTSLGARLSKILQK